LYERNSSVSYYLRRVGGMTKEADKDQLSVIKADGSVIIFSRAIAPSSSSGMHSRTSGSSADS
jgi:hypothetical protein